MGLNVISDSVLYLPLDVNLAHFQAIFKVDFILLLLLHNIIFMDRFFAMIYPFSGRERKLMRKKANEFRFSTCFCPPRKTYSLLPHHRAHYCNISFCCTSDLSDLSGPPPAFFCAEAYHSYTALTKA